MDPNLHEGLRLALLPFVRTAHLVSLVIEYAAGNWYHYWSRYYSWQRIARLTGRAFYYINESCILLVDSEGITWFDPGLDLYSRFLIPGGVDRTLRSPEGHFLVATHNHKILQLHFATRQFRTLCEEQNQSMRCANGLLVLNCGKKLVGLQLSASFRDDNAAGERFELALPTLARCDSIGEKGLLLIVADNVLKTATFETQELILVATFSHCILQTEILGPLTFAVLDASRDLWIVRGQGKTFQPQTPEVKLRVWTKDRAGVLVRYLLWSTPTSVTFCTISGDIVRCDVSACTSTCTGPLFKMGGGALRAPQRTLKKGQDRTTWMVGDDVAYYCCQDAKHHSAFGAKVGKWKHASWPSDMDVTDDGRLLVSRPGKLYILQ